MNLIVDGERQKFLAEFDETIWLVLASKRCGRTALNGYVVELEICSGFQSLTALEVAAIVVIASGAIALHQQPIPR